MANMKIEIVAREIIKPSSPTPQHLKNFKLSLLDQIASLAYTPIILFYTTKYDTDGHVVRAAERSQHLKTSLSKMLTEFYPLAGIVKDKFTLECTDDGAKYIEAHVNCNLSDILKHPDHLLLLRNLLPFELKSPKEGDGCLVIVQVTTFQCGGMGISLSISHKIGDGATMSTILKSWTEIALSGSSNAVKFPAFNAASVFPPSDYEMHPNIRAIHDDSAITKRFVFKSSKIAELKAKAASPIVQQPSRVEAVTAVTWKCLINVSRSIKGFPRLSSICSTANLRKRIVPPLPEHSIGNIVGNFFSSHSTDQEIDIRGLVCKLRKELEALNQNALETTDIKKKVSLNIRRMEDYAKREDTDFFVYTSWCRFGFYEANFGWGKPTWASVPNGNLRNVILLMDTSDGEGIEAFVMLSKQDMDLFERDKELLEFASVDPTVLSN